MLTYLAMPLIVLAVGIGLGWYMKGVFVAADLQAVSDTAKKL